MDLNYHNAATSRGEGNFRFWIEELGVEESGGSGVSGGRKNFFIASPPLPPLLSSPFSSSPLVFANLSRSKR